MMRALVVEQLLPDYAGCVIKDLPTPEPGPGEVRIKVKMHLALLVVLAVDGG